jgi:hypothetical protein
VLLRLLEVAFDRLAEFGRRGFLGHFRQGRHQLPLGAVQVLEFVQEQLINRLEFHLNTSSYA